MSVKIVLKKVNDLVGMVTSGVEIEDLYGSEVDYFSHIFFV